MVDEEVECEEWGWGRGWREGEEGKAGARRMLAGTRAFFFHILSGLRQLSDTHTHTTRVRSCHIIQKKHSEAPHNCYIDE